MAKLYPWFLKLVPFFFNVAVTPAAKYKDD